MDIGLYLHVPFCVHKCGYCNFASGEFTSLSQESYVDALLSELNSREELKNNKVHTIFIGGGTPSYLETKILRKLLKGVKAFSRHAVEWTVENNPGSLTKEKIFLYQEYGVNRLSLGVQSFDEKELKFLERQHNVVEAHNAIELVQQYYESKWNVDLIYALPEQTETSWLKSINDILQYDPSHLSLYELTYETQTALGQLHKKGKIKSLGDEAILRLQQSAIDMLSESQLKRYEISNYAKTNKECQHNLNIWKAMEFIGCGNGAHGRYDWTFHRNVSSPSEYIKKINKNKNAIVEKTTDNSASQQLMTLLVLGLRSIEGVSTKKIKKITGFSEKELWPELPNYLKKKLIFKEKSIVCHAEGWNVLDQIVIELTNIASKIMLA